MRLLIVEDEKIIRNGLLRHLPWDKMEIQEVYAAENAGEAFRICEKSRPNIVLSDIRMPGIDGVEMCRELQRKYPEVQIIFLTGYVEKEYLKAAIDLSAVSYIEKPIVLSEVQKAVRRAVENIQKEKIRKEAELHRLLMSGTEAGKYFGAVSWCQVFLIRVQKPEELPQIRRSVEECVAFRRQSDLIHLIDVVSPATMALLTASRSGNKEKEQMEKHLTRVLEKFQSQESARWFLASGREGYSTEQIPDSYQTACETLKSLAWKGWNRCAWYPQEQWEYRAAEEDRQTLDKFGRAVSQHQSAEAVKIVEEFYRQLIQKKVVLGYPVLHVTDEFWRVLVQNSRSVAGNYPSPDREDYAFLPEEAATLEELSDMLRKAVIARLTDNQNEETAEAKGGFVVQKVVDDICQNYRDPDLSIRILAEHVYLTPTYLSNLFKKYTGTTIGQYLTDLRIEEAKKLLRDPKYKLYQIAELSGYKDPNYFAKTFKKKTGYTPSEYRENGCL